MTLRRAGSLFALVLLAGSPLFSQLIPLGPEFRVNGADLHTTEAPALALDGSGRLLAAWVDPISDGQYDTENDILVRFFERNGEPAGPATVVPTAGMLKDHPVLLALPSGGFAVAWENTTPPPPILPPPPGLGDSETLSLRILDAAGTPVGEEMRIDRDWGAAAGVRLALLSSGGFVATWVEDKERLMARLFGANGTQTGTEITLAVRDGSVPGFYGNDAVEGLEDGFLAFWSYTLIAASRPTRAGWRFDAVGQAIGGPFVLPDGKVAMGGGGRITVATSNLFPGVPPGDDVDARLSFYDSQGRASGHSVPVAVGAGVHIVQAAEMDEDGNTLVVWSNEIPAQDPFVDADLSARLFNAAGQPLGPAFAVATDTAGDQLGVKVAERGGEWVISWVTEPGGSGGGNLFARRFASCITGGADLCLGGRFRARVTWKAPGIGTGTGAGQAVPMTDDTGAFWFFGPENLELVVKALDGRTFNSHYWVFYGALSNVEYDLTVTDAVTGTRRVYHNPAGTLASKADTQAFRVTGSSRAPVAPRPEPWGSSAPILPWSCPDGHLCLTSFNLFDVEVTWRLPNGATGSGKPVRLTDDSGYFWFFDDDNVELMIKMVNGEAVNGKLWIFYGALSDVEYTIKVTDRRSGKVKTYHNPAGTMASRADTSAF